MRGPLPKISDYVPGRWSATPPTRAGVYLMRLADKHSWVAFWNPHAWNPSVVASAATTAIEFFYLRGDRDGEPTRWDDERVAQIAARNGWRPTEHDARSRSRE
jgi:hypothetical protein